LTALPATRRFASAYWAGGRGTENANERINSGDARVVALADPFQDQPNVPRLKVDKL
jgi:hypothetical protein